MSAVLAAIAEPNRREILRLVWTRERAAGDIAARLPVTFGAVSQHLRVLREAGLVVVRRDGKQRFYRAKVEALGPLAAALEAMWAEALGSLKRLAEDEEAKAHDAQGRRGGKRQGLRVRRSR
jgi:DNA-binding transcriptional ArsR family regulator